MSGDLHTPRYARPDVLRVTALRPDVLQTWINRGVIKLAEQNPGYGRRRFYCALDILKLCVMRRLSDLGIDLSFSKKMADYVESLMAYDAGISWNNYIFLRPNSSGQPGSLIPHPAFTPQMWDTAGLHAVDANPTFVNVAMLVEPNRDVAMRRPFPTWSDIDSKKVSPNPREWPIDEARREKFAREGVHAEPVIVFPLGEIVNGALAQLQALDDGRASST